MEWYILFFMMLVEMNINGKRSKESHFAFSELLTVVECEVVVPESGNATVNGTGLGSVVEYTCDIGFDLIGTSLQICLENDAWSDEIPVCECKLLLFLPNFT